MEKHILKSRKFWTAILTVICTVLAHTKIDPSVAAMVASIGATLIAGFGLEDFGKSRASSEEHEEHEEDEEDEEDE